MLKIVSKTGVGGRSCRVVGTPSCCSSLSSSSSYYRGARPEHGSLSTRVIAATGSAIPVLQQWLDQGRTVARKDIKRIIKQFSISRRFENALQICEWLGDMKMFDLTPVDVAVRLNLTSKVHGVAKAEEYISSVPESLRDYHVYGALLQCYTESRNIDKAECIFQKIREMGQLDIVNYNLMMSLYSKTGEFDKMNSLIKDSEQKGIRRDKYSYNIQLRAFVSSNDIEGMENLMMKMENDRFLRIDWHMYSIVAEGYVKVGDTGKALTALKRFEHFVRSDRGVTAYQVLMTQYARLGKKQDVYRMFYLLKKFGKSQNNCYLCMISSLEKLDDLDEAEKIIEEWLLDKRYADMRVPNMLVTAYCKRGQVEKAILFINSITDHGVKPNPDTWFRVARGYLKCKSEDKAVEILKKTILEIDYPQKIDFFTLAGCVEYLNKIGDVSRAEELIQFTEKHNHSSVDVRSIIMEHISRRNLAPKDETSEGDTAKECEEELSSTL